MDSKAEDTWNVDRIGGKGVRHQITERHQKEVRKSRSKGGTIHTGTAARSNVAVVVAPRSYWRRVVDTLAFGAKDFDSMGTNLILDSHGEHRLASTLYKWAGTELFGSILFQ